MAGRLMKNGKTFYLFTMPGHPFPDSPVLTNSAWSYLRHTDFLMFIATIQTRTYAPFVFLSTSIPSSNLSKITLSPALFQQLNCIL